MADKLENENNNVENINNEIKTENKSVDFVEDGEVNASLLQTKDPTIFKPLSYVYSGQLLNDEIEKCRINYRKNTKVPRIFDIVSLGVSFLVIIAALIVFVTVGINNFTIQIVLLSVAIGVLIASFVLSRIFNKKKTVYIQKYLLEYEEIIMSKLFYELKVNDATMAVAGKIDEQDIIRTHYFSTINRIESRVAFEGTRNGNKFTGAEVAVIVPNITLSEANKLPTEYVDINNQSVEVINQESPQEEKPSLLSPKKKGVVSSIYLGVLGKFFSYDFKVESNESIIIAFKGPKEKTYLPNYTQGFKAIKINSLNENIIVYAVDIEKSKKYFDEKGIEILNHVHLNEDFQSGFISINSYGTKVSLNLSDAIMTLPMKDVKDSPSFDNFVNGVISLFKYVDYVEDKSKVVEYKSHNTSKKEKVVTSHKDAKKETKPTTNKSSAKKEKSTKNTKKANSKVKK